MQASPVSGKIYFRYDKNTFLSTHHFLCEALFLVDLVIPLVTGTHFYFSAGYVLSTRCHNSVWLTCVPQHHLNRLEGCLDVRGQRCRVRYERR